MKSNIEILRDELNRRTGEIRRIADAVDMSYDTVLRIKNGECDPGFAKVEKLAKYLGVGIFCDGRKCK